MSPSGLPDMAASTMNTLPDGSCELCVKRLPGGGRGPCVADYLSDAMPSVTLSS